MAEPAEDPTAPGDTSAAGETGAGPEQTLARGSARPTGSRSRRGLPFSRVALGIAVVAVLFVGATALTYFRYLRYESAAPWHLPPDTTLALHLSVEQGVVYEPFRKHLLPLLSQAGAQEAHGQLVRDIEKRAGIERMHLREVVLARGESWDAWTVGLGGVFPRTGVLEGLAEVLRAHPMGAWRVVEDGSVLESPSGGLAIGQAEDGVLLLATGRERLRQALARQTTWQTLGLQPDAAGSLGAGDSFLRALREQPVPSGLPGLDVLEQLARVRATLLLDGGLSVDVRLDFAEGTEPDHARGEALRLVGAVRRLSALVPGDDLAGERWALDRAQVEALGPREVRILLAWSREDMERGAENLAGGLQAVLRGSD